MNYKHFKKVLKNIPEGKKGVRPILQSVYFSDDKYTATDAFKLYEKSIDVPEHLKGKMLHRDSQAFENEYCFLQGMNNPDSNMLMLTKGEYPKTNTIKPKIDTFKKVLVSKERLQKLLNAFEGEDVELYINGADTVPIVIKSEDQKEYGLLMPLKSSK